MIHDLGIILAKLTITLGLLSTALAAPAVYIVTPEIPPNVWIGYGMLKRICAAESNYSPNNEPRQFLPDGSVLWGWEKDPVTGKDHIVHRDVGACQINTEVHADELRRLGLDVVNSEADNIAYAKILYDREGWIPWKASKKHWSHD